MYVEGHKSLTVSVAITEGKSVHKAMELNNHHKVKEGEDLPTKELVEVFSDTFSNQATEVTDWENEKKDSIIARGSTFMERYRKLFAKKYFPMDEQSIEKKITGEIRGIPVLGYIDLVSQPSNTVPTIVDYKVSKRAKQEREASLSIQMGVYSALMDIPSVRYLCFVKTKTPKITTVNGFRTPDSIQRVERVIDGVADGIKRGSFPYCDPTHPLCCQKYCGVWYACPQGGKA